MVEFRKVPGTKTRLDEGIRETAPEGMGTGNSGAGHAQKGSTPQSAAMPVDRQFKSIL